MPSKKSQINYNKLSPDELIKLVIERGEGMLASNGALAVETGSRTGRSPKDRFIVKDNNTAHKVDWGAINQPILRESFEKLWQQAQAYLANQDCVFTDEFRVGADPTYHVPIQITCDLAWQMLFAHNLFIPHSQEAGLFTQPWSILSAAKFTTDPLRDGVYSDAAIMLDFTKRRLLICGTQYAGEIKKGMFAVLNFLLPDHHVLPMHCAANQGEHGDIALFFGLSGTGKTTLSTDSERFLIGDDEHGWSDQGVFNFEGGCYAKCINLSNKNEPDIWQAIHYGAVMENVIIDPITREPNYDDGRLTQNTRVAYPLSYIHSIIPTGRGGLPQNLIFLSCDLYGVLPAVAKLSKEQAAYYFLSGYTAFVGSTEVGSDVAIKPTFSACFGAPFFPRPPLEYAHLLMDHILASQAEVYLINTGWYGGAYGQGGSRYSIPVTRGIIHAILNGNIKRSKLNQLARFNIEIPDNINGIKELEGIQFDPRMNWPDSDAYKGYSEKLIAEFQNNFKKFEATRLQSAGPI